MSYLCLNNNIVSRFNYLCHVVLSIIFRILFIVFHLSCFVFLSYFYCRVFYYYYFRMLFIIFYFVFYLSFFLLFLLGSKLFWSNIQAQFRPLLQELPKPTTGAAQTAGPTASSPGLLVTLRASDGPVRCLPSRGRAWLACSAFLFLSSRVGYLPTWPIATGLLASTPFAGSFPALEKKPRLRAAILFLFCLARVKLAESAATLLPRARQRAGPSCSRPCPADLNHVPSPAGFHFTISPTCQLVEQLQIIQILVHFQGRRRETRKAS